MPEHPAKSVPLNTNAALDRIADALVKRWSDPTNPENRLKRPVRTPCLNCDKTYMRTLSVLCEHGFCSAECKSAFQRAAFEGWSIANATADASDRPSEA